MTVRALITHKSILVGVIAVMAWRACIPRNAFKELLQDKAKVEGSKRTEG
jgi:hypothetical protein